MRDELPTNGYDVAKTAILGFRDVVLAVVTGVTDWRVSLSAITAVVIVIGLQPPEKRPEFQELVGYLEGLTSSAVFALSGWACAGTLLVVLGFTVAVFISRVQAQGDMLSHYHSQADPGRLSSDDVQGITAYAEMTRRQHTSPEEGGQS